MLASANQHTQARQLFATQRELDELLRASPAADKKGAEHNPRSLPPQGS
jgi:hypothetical protein